MKKEKNHKQVRFLVRGEEQNIKNMILVRYFVVLFETEKQWKHLFYS